MVSDRETNLKYALQTMPDDLRERLLTEALTIDWNFIETVLLNDFANNDWENKQYEKIIKRIGVLKKITFKELPELLLKRNGA